MSERIYQTPLAETLLLAQCAFLAYDEQTTPTPPEGYRFVQKWKGKDPLWGHWGGKVENYGVIFQKISSPTTYIFAFRGTSGALEWWEDLKFFELEQFPYFNGVSGSSAQIASGFNDIYTTKVSASEGSMQEQLFQFIAKNQVEELYITGHSLGSALAEMFTLDLNNYTKSKSATNILIKHINFACPRVGDYNFAQEYNNLESGKPNKTIRIVNWKDYVPCVPSYGLSLTGYYHGPNYYLTYFDWDKYIAPPNPLLRHSIYNYWQVLEKQLNGSPTGTLTGEDGYKVYYWTPSNSYKECQWGFFSRVLDSVSRFFRRLGVSG